MARSRGTCLYQEARVNIEPAFPGSTIAFTLPAQETSTFGVRTRSKRTIVADNYTNADEDLFSKRHLASDGGIFFRRRHAYPRSFLWRLLDERKALEIQSVDLDQDITNKFEANLTLILQFASPIRPFCLAFAEPEDRDALTVIAITTTNELYTITLPRDFFVKPSVSEQEISDWCKRTSVNQLVVRVPYRLVAPSSNELLVALDDGAILSLTRKSKDDIAWHETIYQQSSWSFSGLLTWKNEQKVRFGNTELEGTTAAALAFSPDKKHILSVCLNHKLRAWNIGTGKQGVQMDLLGEVEGPNEKVAPYFIGPSQSTLMAVVNIPGGVEGALYHVVTYSPKQHQFKFWGIRDADDAHLGAYDVRPDVDMIPPVDELMDTTVWTLEEFYVNPGPAGWRNAELWIRARSGPSSKVYSLKFDLNDDELAQTWRQGWCSVDSGPLTVDSLKQNPANPAEHDADLSQTPFIGLTERWLEFLFFPGRFTTPTLEAALRIFRRGRERGKSGSSASQESLKERICTVIGTFAVRGNSNTMDSDAFQNAAAAQWQAFYGLVKDLHKRRGESLSLAFDHEADMPWLVLSDYLSAIRQCSQPDTITLNPVTLATPRKKNGALRELHHVSRLLNAAASFRRNLHPSFHHQLKREVEGELLQSKSLSVIDRMELLEANSDLNRHVSDEDLSLLVEELGMDVKEVTTDTFLRAINTFSTEEIGQSIRRRQVARYGLKALMRVSQETLEKSYNVLLDLLVLILFMQYEEDLSDRFDASDIFVEIINALKDCMLLQWLATTVWSNQSPTGPADEVLLRELHGKFKESPSLPLTQTVLEGIWGGRAFDVSLPNGLRAEYLTRWSGLWLAQIFKGESFDAVLESIMGVLMMQKEFDLASVFTKFLPEGNWTTYLKGRMHIALGENTLASICFQKSAYNLCKWESDRFGPLELTSKALGMFSLEEADTINFIPLEQRESFSDGPSRYYHHVLGLFEKVKAYSFVAEFAHLGLGSLRGKENEESVALRTDLLSRLFVASIHMSRFDEAYSAMTRHSDKAL
jgi:hypothetical protein